MMSRGHLAFVFLLAAVMSTPVTHARTEPLDATPLALSGPVAQYYGYLTPVLVIEKGAGLTYANVDIVRHDLVHDVESDGFGGPKKMPWCQTMNGGEHEHGHAHGCPVFWSAQVGAGQTTDVRGLQNLKPGQTYTFFCTLHHGMKGTLIAR